jgi:hypothetical protein
MFLGSPTLTIAHVVISLIGILSGFIIVFGMMADRRLDGWNALFLTATVLTSVTGFVFFPFHGVTPGIILGILSLIALGIALFARYTRQLAGGWRRTYAIAAVIALYFNVFVLIAQLFEKVPVLHELAPTQKEPPFLVAQITCMVVFIVLRIFSVRGFRVGQSARITA